MRDLSRDDWLAMLTLAAVVVAAAFALAGYVRVATLGAAVAAFGLVTMLVRIRKYFIVSADKMRTSYKETETAIKTLRSQMIKLGSGVVMAGWQTRPAETPVDAALPLVLIAQVQRSGGSLLSQLFDGHPEVLAFPHELKWGGEVKFRWPRVDPSEGALKNAYSLVAENLRQNDLMNLIGYHKSAIGATISDSDQRLQFQWSQWNYLANFLQLWEEKRPQTPRECFDIFMSSYFSAFFDWRGPRAAKVITAFTPRVNFIKSYPENTSFFQDYPDGFMISLCRHPSDWYASARRHQKSYANMQTALTQWRESTESALLLKQQYPSNVLLVQFSSLISQPEHTMQQLASRIGLTWDPVLLVPTFNGMRVTSNSSFAAFNGIDVSVLARRDSIDEETRERIESENLPLFQSFVDRADI